MAHTKAQKATKGNRDSFSKRLGVKVYGGQAIKAGNIIIRQRGTQYNPGENVLCGNDYTLMALKDGTVKFYTRRAKRFVSVV
jgi:large subunit ribosomal protein L27